MFNWIPVAIAALDDIQAIVTVCAGILSENPALSKAYYIKMHKLKLCEMNLNTSRAILDVLTSWITVPIIQYSGIDLSIFVRLTSSLDQQNYFQKFILKKNKLTEEHVELNDNPLNLYK